MMQHLLRSRSLLLCMAIALSAAFVGGGLWPFAWRVPRRVENAATLTEEGHLRLSSAGVAYPAKRPAWVDNAIGSHQLQIELRIRSFASDQPDTARIFTLSRDAASRNFTVGQDGSDLVFRLRRDRLYNGRPAFRVPDVFVSDDWHDIDIRVNSSAVTIRLNGETVLTRSLPADPLAQWNPDFRIALGNELSGNRAWRGEIARATVIVGDARFDYIPSRDLVIPATFIDGMHRDFFLPISDSVHRRDAVMDISLNFLLFVPIGFLYAAAMSWRPTLAAILICVALSLTVELGQLFLEYRMTSCVDLLVNSMGGAVGALVASRLLSQRRSH